MTAALVVTLAVAVLAATGTAVGLALALVRAERGANALELLLGKERARVDDYEATLGRVRAGAMEDHARREKLITDLKRRVTAAEARALACDAPGAVRDDLRSLLGALEDDAGARSLAASDLLPLRAAAEPTPVEVNRPGRAG